MTVPGTPGDWRGTSLVWGEVHFGSQLALGASGSIHACMHGGVKNAIHFTGGKKKRERMGLGFHCPPQGCNPSVMLLGLIS